MNVNLYSMSFIVKKSKVFKAIIDVLDIFVF